MSATVVMITACSSVYRNGDFDQFTAGHLVTCNQEKHLGIVPDHNGWAAPVDVFGLGFRSELVNACRASPDLRVAPGGAIPHIECQAPGFIYAFARLT